MSGPALGLDRVEVRPVLQAPSAEAEQAAREWMQAQQRARFGPGMVFSAAGHEFAVVLCSPPAGGVLAAGTDICLGGAPVPALVRVQLMCLDDPARCGGEGAGSRLYHSFVRPYLLRLREECHGRGGRFLAVLLQDQVVSATGHEFGVRAIDPGGRCGAIDETTAVYVSFVETPALEKVHVLPYGDTLPGAYTYSLFRDFLQPFFQAHPFAVFREGDHFAFRGVRFRVMATDPRDQAARVSNQTMVYSDGLPLQPTIWDRMPPELREDLQRFPPGLQALLLNTMANEEAIHGRLTEVQDVLRRGQGMAPDEIQSCGQTLTWVEAERTGDTQQQCMVCLAEFEGGSRLRQLDCGHLFHRDCVDEWLQRSAACPICKRSVCASAVPASSSVGARLLHNARVACSYGQCTVIGFDASCKKFRLALEGGGREQLAAADEFVQCLAGVRLVGLSSGEFNGMVVEIVGLDTGRGRYLVQLHGGRVIGVKPSNCILPSGSVVRVVGLLEDGRWNGQYGRIVDFDQPRMRHVLTMEPRGHFLSVKPENLRA